MFAVAMLELIPIFLPLLSVFVPILSGIPFMLFLTKVKKPGMIFLFAMMTSTVRIGENLSASALTRGLGRSVRSGKTMQGYVGIQE